MRWVGIGYRRELANWIDSHPRQIGCLEITAEHFFDNGKEQLCALRKSYPILVHGLGLSLATPGRLDPRYLARLAEVCKVAQAEWVSDHIAFTRTDEVDLGHLNPVAPTEAMLDLMVDHAREVMAHCERPLLLENIASHLKINGTMHETEFMNRLCERAGCGLLLDVTNLFVNSRNHGFDAMAWLHEIEPTYIVQLHVVGYSRSRARWEDLHAEPIQDEIYHLLDEVLAYARVRAVVIERDENFPPHGELIDELEKLEAAVARH